MQRLHRNRRRFFNSQQYRVTWTTAQLTRQALTHERLSILRRRNTGHTIELPEPLINTINLHSTGPALTRLMDHHAVERDQRARHADAARDKLPSLFEVRGKLFAEEVGRGNQIVSLAEPPRGKISQTA